MIKFPYKPHKLTNKLKVNCVKRKINCKLIDN